MSEPSRNTAARVAGLLYLVTNVTAIVARYSIPNRD